MAPIHMPYNCPTFLSTSVLTPLHPPVSFNWFNATRFHPICSDRQSQAPPALSMSDVTSISGLLSRLSGSRIHTLRQVLTNKAPRFPDGVQSSCCPCGRLISDFYSNLAIVASLQPLNASQRLEQCLCGYILAATFNKGLHLVLPQNVMRICQGTTSPSFVKEMDLPHYLSLSPHHRVARRYCETILCLIPVSIVRWDPR